MGECLDVISAPEEAWTSRTCLADSQSYVGPLGVLPKKRHRTSDLGFASLLLAGVSVEVATVEVVLGVGGIGDVFGFGLTTIVSHSASP